MPRNTGPAGSSEEMEKQTAGAGSRASIFKHLLVQLPPVLHRRQLWGTLQHLLRRPAQISVAEQMGTVSRDIKLLKASQRMSTGGEQEAREYLNLKFQPIKAYKIAQTTVQSQVCLPWVERPGKESVGKVRVGVLLGWMG